MGRNLFLLIVMALFGQTTYGASLFGPPPVKKPAQHRSQFIADNGPSEELRPARRTARPPAKAPERPQPQRENEPEESPQENPERRQPIRPSNDNVQQAQCYPATEEARNWPVKAIYLHGLFEPSGSGTGYQNLEKRNMQQMKELAERLKIRIALPRAQRVTTYKGKRVRSWTGSSLQEIENASRTACGGSPLGNGRALIGFSNGGYKAREISKEVCKPGTQYSRIFAIGAPESSSARCSFMTVIDRHPHQLPDNDYFANNMAIPLPPVRLPAAAAIRRSAN